MYFNSTGNGDSGHPLYAVDGLYFDSDGKAEIIVKTAYGTKDNFGTVIGKESVYYGNSNGYVIEGDEFLTVFEGATGKILDTIPYTPPRGNVKDWGDDIGNRADRFLVCVAYLDGVHPSVVRDRGYMSDNELFDLNAPLSTIGGFIIRAVWGEDFSDGKVRVKLSGPPILTIADEAVYILSVAGANELATVTVWFEVDGTYLNSLTAEAYTDILSMSFGLKELGDTTVKISKITLSGYDEADKAVFFGSIIRNGTVDTEIVYNFSPYDLNKDKVVDQLDLTIAQKYFRVDEGDTNWDEAKIADVNGDSVVDINDFILILNNIVW